MEEMTTSEGLCRMKREKEIRLQILREAREVKEGTGLGWPKDRVANEIACELISDGLALGSVSDYGNACITGIRDAGLEYLEDQKASRKMFVILRRVGFVLYSIILIIMGYIFNLDSVKAFFSDIMKNILE